MSKKKLTKSHNKKVSGVLGGLADYYALDATVLRLIFVFFVLVTGFFPGILLYIIAALIVDQPSHAHRS